MKTEGFKCLASWTLRERLDNGAGPADPVTGCMDWSGGLKNGYGRLTAPGGARMYAHRVALALKLGRDLRDGEVTRHKCDNPPCVNPDHLEPGSTLENMRDCVDRGRHSARSEKAVQLMAEAKRLRISGLKLWEIGERIGVQWGVVGVWLAEMGCVKVRAVSTDKADKMAKVWKMASEGRSQTDMGKAVGVSQTTVSNWLKRMAS